MVSRLKAAIIAHGHALFAMAHTALFKIIFQPHDVVPAELNDLTRDMFLKKTNASYHVLRDACAPFGQNKAMTKTNSTTNNSP